jgi:uncharacterized protein YlxP (DUF503 family)
VGAYVALMVVHLHFPDAHSLKARRKELSSVKALLHQRYGVSAAEVDVQDTWQRATLALALTGGSPARLQAAADRVVRFLDERFPQGVRVDRMLTSFEDLGVVG